MLDASWYLPVHKRDAVEEFKASRLPGAQFFDLDAISDTSVGEPGRGCPGGETVT